MAELYDASDEALDDQAAAIKAAHVHLRELGNSIALIAAAAHRAGREQAEANALGRALTAYIEMGGDPNSEFGHWLAVTAEQHLVGDARDYGAEVSE